MATTSGAAVNAATDWLVGRRLHSQPDVTGMSGDGGTPSIGHTSNIDGRNDWKIIIERDFSFPMLGSGANIRTDASKLSWSVL